MKLATLGKIVLSCLALSLFTPVRAAWQVIENPRTGDPIAIWMVKSAKGNETSIYASALADNAWSIPRFFSVPDGDEQNLALVPLPTGGVGVAWGTPDPTGTVLARTLADPAGVWGSTVVVSGSDERAGGAAITYDGASFQVAYVSSAPSGPRTLRVGKFDSGGSVERTIVAKTANDSDPSLEIHTEGGRTWLDWVESGTSMGFSEWIDGGWTGPQFEPISNPNEVDSPRGRIRARVLGRR